jgi:hypothetical protein
VVDMPNIALNRRKVSLVVFVVAIFFTAIWFLHRTSVHSHFGRIYVAHMSESYTYWQMARVTVSKWLYRLPGKPYYDLGLPVGPSVLGWSSHENSPSKRDGYIYMRNPLPSGGNAPLWEFALATKLRLSEVTRDELKCEYYGMDDPRGTNIFGAAWTGAALLVPEGQVFFGRLVTNRSVIYVIRLAKQRGRGRGSMRIEYVVVTNQPPKIGQANRRAAFPLDCRRHSPLTFLQKQRFSAAAGRDRLLQVRHLGHPSDYA